MTRNEFAQLVKTKYPEWGKIEDDTLVDLVLERYPNYKSQITEIPTTSTTPSQKEEAPKSGNILSRYAGRVVDTLKESFGKAKESVVRGAEMVEEGDTAKGLLRGTLGTTAAGARGIFSPITAAISPAIEKGVEKTMEGVDVVSDMPIVQKIAMNPTVSRGLDTIFGGADKVKQWVEENPNDANILVDALEVAASAYALKQTKPIAGAIKQKATGMVDDLGRIGTGVKGVVTEMSDDLTRAVSKTIPDKVDDAVRWFAKEPDEAIKSTLKKAGADKIDDFAKIAQARATDITKPTVFNKVSESFTKATKQIDKQLKSIGKQKQQILNKAKIGQEQFVDAPRRAILEVNKIDGLSPSLKNSIINKLKGVKTKLDADRAIDEIQNLIYTEGVQKTLPTGSASSKMLKGVIGKLNGELKNSLPESYRVLNTKYSNMRSYLNVLNKSLGETVDGVSFSGSSLVKRYFSPSSDKTRALFDFVKKSTGVDLAEDAVVAKFIADLYGDNTARMLLEGIPTTKKGVLDAFVDLVAEKSGVGSKIKEILRKATLEKAKR